MNDNYYEKENSVERSYQIKTRQYNNARQSNYLPKAYQNYRNYPQETKQMQQRNKYDQTDYDAYSKGKIDSQWEYKRHDMEKNVLVERNERLPERQKREKYFPNEKLMIIEDENTSTNSRRDNARKQELQMKMNNINHINDKISSLLNMVKKERIQFSSKEKSVERPVTYGRRQHSPLPNRLKSPVPTRQISPRVNNTFQKSNSIRKEEKEPVKQKDLFKQNCKSLQRLRALSSLEPTLHSNNRKNDQWSRQKYNQEDNRYGNRNLSPSIISKNRKKMEEKEGKYDEEDRKVNLNSYKYSPSPKYDSNYDKDQGKVQKNTSSRYDKICEKYQNFSNKKEDQDNYSRNPSKNSNYQNFMPITMVQQSQQNEERYFENYPGMKMIDEQLKRIKGKINESQGQNSKYRQRFAPKEKRYKYQDDVFEEGKKNVNKFELKIQPVEIDRTQTIKIAEKMSFQIELDNRIRAALPSFHQIPGQQKWRDFESKASKNGIKIHISQIKEYLNVLSQYSHDNQGRSSRKIGLAQQFCEAQQFWDNQMTRCVSSRALKNEGFHVSQLDSKKKGFLSLQDLVSFINVYTGRHYSNNDLALIYRRLEHLQGEEKDSRINFSTFMKAFTL